ncbi:hypothetical protein BDV95DRAFT_123478 [Massariosphaeria phaeospora]|uniref:RING-type domain-containing protein n=1 Tax=Massariosphaeria phaeospora TaxID=100035 RepID=A0A7C8I209_9PLEO|nr:hypothetical protein BDV95DRAFT_123478 [Massariosphaeria phaeospora]
MTARSIGITTVWYPDPSLSDSKDENYNNVNVERGEQPFGVLYVPTLQTNGCKKSEADHVSANATRLRNLPPDPNFLIAIAPWYSPTCMLEYFATARESSVQAFLVYQPGAGAGMPPVMNDASWALGDGGSWKTANNFPTYAVSPAVGAFVVDQLSLYSSSIRDVPNGAELASELGPANYVRLFATVQTVWGNQLPSLWVFLIIVVLLLVAVMGGTSAFMHLVLRRRRNSLRQRVHNGEVDLEQLGVKRLTVPKLNLEKLPLYSYTIGPASDVEKTSPLVAQNMPSPAIQAETGSKSSPFTRRTLAPDVPTQPNTLPGLFQPTCPICLDDFEPNETQVRELPCRHIYHPDCIDPFLLNNSSLCPLCKSSVLPAGYCPAKITNTMVRRERMITSMRTRSSANGASNGTQAQPYVPQHAPGTYGSLGSRLGRIVVDRRVFSAPERTQPRPPDIEMASSSPTQQPPNTISNQHQSEALPAPATRPADPTPGCVAPAAQNRREWARERALTLLGNRHVPGEGEEDDTVGPRWRRGLRKIFPGFR